MERKLVLAILPFLLAAVGQTTAPATQSAGEKQQAIFMANVTAHTVSNPAYEALLATIPANLLPPAKHEADSGMARNKQLREWDKTHLDGKPVKVTVYSMGAIDGEFFIPGSAIKQVQVRVAGEQLGKKGDAFQVEGTLGNGMVNAINLLPDGSGTYYTYSLLIKDAKVTPVSTPASQPAN